MDNQWSLYPHPNETGIGLLHSFFAIVELSAQADTVPRFWFVRILVMVNLSLPQISFWPEPAFYDTLYDTTKVLI